jgi:hypothetical protein
MLGVCIVLSVAIACTPSPTEPKRSITATIAPESPQVVSGIALERAPAVVAEQCQHAASAVGYPAPCPRLLPSGTTPYPPANGFVATGLGPSSNSVVENMVFPAAGTRLTVSPFDSQGHLVIWGSPKGTNLQHLLYGPAPDPRYDHVVRVGTARVRGIRAEFVRVLATNTGSIFLDHLVIAWSSGGHLYAVGFHRVNEASRALDLAIARSIVLVPPE